MHRHRILIPAALLAAVLPTGLAAAETGSRVDRVTLYPGQVARVERVAEVELAGGPGELVFADLPAALGDDSVRVAVESGGARLGGVEVAREPVDSAPRERERALQDQIDQRREQRQTALDGVAAARSQITFIEGLARLPEGEGAAEALTGGEGDARWAALQEHIGEGSRAAYARLRAGERRAAALEDEIEALQRQLDQLGNERRERVRVSVPYASADAGRALVRLSYRVRGPRWEPLYETRLDTAEGRLRLVRAARVRQATGEDWRDVRLSLSTVRPVRGEQPRPGTWWIDLAPENRARVDKAADEAALGAAMQAAPEPEGGARTVNAAFAATYEIPGRISVPAGNQPRELRIATDELEAEIGARVFPQRDTRAWLTAGVTWDGAGPLPGGRVARFRDGAYVGTGRLEAWAPGEARDLAFGIDPRIDIRFEPTRDEAGESGWITTESTRARSYRLTVANRHERALPVTALFRVPVSRDEAIEVETDFERPPTATDIEDRRGVHAWRLDLGAGESGTLDLGYSVSWPEGQTLRGLN